MADASSGESGPIGSESSSSGEPELVDVFDACVEVLTAGALASCSGDDICIPGDGQPDAAWCHSDTCMTLTAGEIVDACNGLVIVGMATVERSKVDACLADADQCLVPYGEAGFGGVCEGPPPLFGSQCSPPCNELGILEGCMESDVCFCHLCGVMDDSCSWGTGTG